MITWHQISNGVVRKFLPAAAVTALLLEIPSWVVVGVRPLSLALLAVSLGAMGAGYASVLGALRSRLRDDADVGGRRAIVAGIGSLGLIVASAAVWRLGTPSLLGGVARIAGLYFASGAAVTLGLYFPWIATRQRDGVAV